MSESLDIQRAKLLGSFILFTQVFYKLRTGRDFVISQPIGRESHYHIIAKALTRVLRGANAAESIEAILRLIINVPPRYGKTELLIHFVAWGMAHFPDSNFIFVSYSHTLAKKQTQTIKEIISLPEYRKLFGVQIKDDASAKDNFETIQGGSVYAVGAAGTITGRGAGIQNCNRFSGAIIIDDIHKPSEVVSDTMRASVNDWFLNTLQSRVNSPTTPIIFIGQRLHEDDLAQNLINGFDGHTWQLLSLSALDGANNALLPTMHTKEQLLDMKEKMPYVFSSQYQQTPQPAGGGIFKPEWFVLLDEVPDILATFITADTAESIKSYADYTVFSFFGIYKLKHKEVDLGLYGLYWIDCYEAKIEPKDLENEYMQFWSDCMRFTVKPKLEAIETKSTGTTLASVMKSVQGMQILEIDRNAESGSKTERFLRCQPYVASKQVALPRYGKHTNRCLEHMRKITANDTHRHDDIADTLADGIQLGLISQVISHKEMYAENDAIVAKIANAQRNYMNASGFDSWRK
jgi:predicted phage terminase large subunit-like protein